MNMKKTRDMKLHDWKVFNAKTCFFVRPKNKVPAKKSKAHNRKNNLEVTNLGPWSPSPDMQNDDPNLGDFLP